MRVVHLDKDTLIEESMKREWKVGCNTTDAPLISDSCNNKAVIDEGMVFMRIVLNSIAYLSSEGAEIDSFKSYRTQLARELDRVKSKSKRKKKEKIMSRYSALDYEFVGKNIKPIDFKPRTETRNGTGVGRPHTTAKRMVMGHWRSQPYGKGRMLRKKIRIEPYYKGSDSTETLNNPHIVH